nr:hypothetical protein [Tanacetum cinerariifolium]
MMGDKTDLSLQDHLMKEEADFDLKSMPDDKVESVFGFEAIESTDEENDTIKTKDMMGDKTDLSLQDHLMKEEADFDLKSMPDDKVESVFGFEAIESTDEENDTIKTKVEISSLTTKSEKLKSSLAKKVPDKLEESIHRIVVDAFAERMPNLLADTLKSLLP